MSRDNAEFAEFFAASWDPCLRAVAASTGNMTLAEDQTAEAFARAWVSWHKISHHPAPRAWVVRTALNAGASWRHRRSKGTTLTSHDIVAADSQGVGLDTAVLTALRRLPARQREVIVLRVFLDLDIDMAARQLALIRELHDSLSELAAPERPPLAAIINKGRAPAAAARKFRGPRRCRCRRGHRAGTRPNRCSRRGPARSAGTIRTAAFTLTRNANGTDTLTLTHSQMFGPAALQQALTQHGIPALVKTSTYCWSNPAAPDPGSLGVLSIRPPIKLPHRGAVMVPSDLKPRALNWIVDHTVTVINPAAMPSGTELFSGYFNSGHAMFFDLIYSKSYTCNSGPQPPANP